MDTLQAVAAEIRQCRSIMGTVADGLMDAWADRIETLAASAQVREVEALPCALFGNPEWQMNLSRALKAEPVPVAQGDVQANLATLKALAKSDPAALALAAIKVIEQQAATIERLRGAFDDADETASVHWYGEWVEQKRRAEQAEASLAACRAEVARLRELAGCVYAGPAAVHNLPDHWLDALLAASQGESFSCDALLPYEAEEAAP